jgi:hypothetical protein
MRDSKRVPKITSFVVLLVLVAAVVPGTAAAATEVGVSVVVERGETVTEDVTAGAGSVLILGRVEGNVTALAGNVVVTGEVTGDVTAVGGNVEVTGDVGGGLTAFAINLGIDGTVGREVDAIVAFLDVGGHVRRSVETIGFFVEVERTGRIDDGLQTTAYRTVVNGTIGGVSNATRNATGGVSNETVNESTNATGNQTTASPPTGNATTAERNATRDRTTESPLAGNESAPAQNAPSDRTTDAPSDRMTSAPGDRMTNAPGDRMTNAPGDRMTDGSSLSTANLVSVSDGGAAATPLQLVPGLGRGDRLSLFDGYGFLVNLLLGAILVGWLPNFSTRVASTVVRHPVRSGGTGVAVLLAAPVVLVVLALSVFGIPLALAGLSLYVVSSWVGVAYGRFAVGTWLFVGSARLLGAVGVETEPVRNRWARLLVGYLAVTLLIRVPYVGTAVDGIVLALGLGALSSLAYDAYTRSERTRLSSGERVERPVSED